MSVVTLSTVVPGGLDAAVSAAASAAAEGRIIERIWAGDDTVFGPAGQPEVADRLGWLQIGERTGALMAQLDALAASAREHGDRVVLVLGMGGSSLAPEVLRRAFPAVDGAPELRVLDSTVPAAVLEALGGLDPETTLVIAASKSGGTVETRSQLDLLWERFGGDGQQFVAITDPGSDLERLARERGFRDVVLGDPEVGGRYSALTAFGLTPAAVAGFPASQLLASGVAAAELCTDPDADANPGLALGLLWAEAALAGRDKLTILADPSLGGVELWLEQLVAESTGKHGVGILPVHGEPEPASRAGADRVVLRLRDRASASSALDEAASTLQAAGLPVATLEVNGPEGLGALCFVTELATAVAGWRLGINPFDQPNVQEAKDATKSVLTSTGGQVELPSSQVRTAVEAVLDGIELPGYVAVLAYLAPSPAADQAAVRLQGALSAAGGGVAVTFGYGPRYLHSTGQLHKGGPATGRFLLVVDDTPPDVAIPDADFSFRTLAHAQALGDLNTLHAHGLVAELVKTGGATVETLNDLADRAARLAR